MWPVGSGRAALAAHASVTLMLTQCTLTSCPFSVSSWGPQRRGQMDAGDEQGRWLQEEGSGDRMTLASQLSPLPPPTSTAIC